MREDLDINNIMSSDEIDDLFSDSIESNEDIINEDQDANKTPEQKENNKEKEQTTEVNVDALFTDKPESVSSGEENTKVGEDADSNKDASPKTNFYSSIAKALKEDGIIPDLDEKEIKSPEDFASGIDKYIKSKLDEHQKRVAEALELGVEPTEIKRYENTLSYLETIKEEALKDESDKGEKLRQQLIYQDFINRGYSEERAKREVTKSLNAGTDIEDAKEALNGNKEFFKKEYDNLINQAREEELEYEKNRKEQAQKLQKSLLEDSMVFGELKLDKTIRQKALDNISKPVYKDPKTGEMYTAIQKYEKDNRVDFLKNIGIIYTLTDGFTNLKGLIKDKVNNEVKKGIRELEHTLNNTSRSNDGNLKFVSGVNDDTDSIISKGWNLDIE